MCLRILGNCLCCCCQLGLKILCSLIFSIIGVVIIIALVVYFCVFHNKSKETTTEAATTMTTVLEEMSSVAPKEVPARVRTFIQQMIDRF